MQEPTYPLPTRNARTLLPLLVLVVVALSLAAVFSRIGSQTRFNGTAYDPPAPAPDFLLTDHRGAAFRLSELQGQAVLLFFGFVHCPEFCPQTLSRLSRVLDSIGAGPDRVRVVLVTVDPDRDTPEAMAAYLRNFSAPITGVTGSAEQLAEVWRSFGVYAAPQHGDHGVDIAHTTRVFGIDRNGNLRVLIAPEEPESVVEADVRALLRAR